MKILIITRNAWDDTNAIGNTLSNFFCGVDNIEFAALYFRMAMPNNQLCSHYYRTSEMDVVRKWFKPHAIGESFDYSVKNQDDHREKKSISEKKVVRLVQKYGVKAAYRISEYLWYSEKWINDNLDDFVEAFSPDMMVTFVKSAPQYYLAVKHLREKYNIPLFSWIADDEYTGLIRTHSKKEIRNLQYILDESKVVKGCSMPLCDYYNSVFACHAEPLYKSCDLSLPVKDKMRDSITIAYAGNLLYGRLDIICQIADVLSLFSTDIPNVILEVYSNTTLLSAEEKTHFNSRPVIKYMGKKEYGYIKKRLSEVDVVLHVESFDCDQILRTKYSFSTKIMDYLQSGNVILAVGPRELASIQYIQNIPGAAVIDNLEEITDQLKDFLDDRDRFYERALQIRNYAQHYHSLTVAAENMQKIIGETIKGEV